jgi:GTP-binding protein EngB required for normal cell division
MRDRLVGLVDKADLAVALCRGVVSDDELIPVAFSVDSVRLRLAYPEDLLVAAFAGGTGSGKSSLLNAIVGEEIADVGGVRPTTAEPLAVVGGGRAAAVDGYLTSIGVADRRVADLPDWLCLIDMPDTDSVEIEHRLTVEALLPRLDIVVWVVDPEKYRDAAFHDSYVGKLAAYESQFVFVLNQADRLNRAELEAVSADFVDALSESGIGEATIVVCSANPPAGPSLGITDLVSTLERRVGERPGVYDKLLIDLEEAAITLLERTGGSPVGFDAEATRVSEIGQEAIMDGDITRVIDTVTAFLAGIESVVGGPTATTLNEIIASTPITVDEVAKRASEVDVSGGWWRKKQRRLAAEEHRRALVEESLERSIFGPARKALRTRAEANAALTDLALSIASARSV